MRKEVEQPGSAIGGATTDFMKTKKRTKPRRLAAVAGSGRKNALTVAIVDGMLTIQIGVETLAFAAEQHPTMGCPRVTDVDGFAEEVAEEMERETMGYNEVANVAQFLDSMCEAVLEGGSLCVEDV